MYNLKPELTATEIIDDAVRSLGVHFAGINEGYLVFSPISPSVKLGQDTLIKIAARLREADMKGTLDALPPFNAIQLLT
jgi:hypothetical protein